MGFDYKNIDVDKPSLGNMGNNVNVNVNFEHIDTADPKVFENAVDTITSNVNFENFGKQVSTGDPDVMNLDNFNLPKPNIDHLGVKDGGSNPNKIPSQNDSHFDSRTVTTGDPEVMNPENFGLPNIDFKDFGKQVSTGDPNVMNPNNFDLPNVNLEHVHTGNPNLYEDK